MKYHVFFTAKYTEPCLENGRFGATSVNSLVDVKKEDRAFLFDGSKWIIFGPLRIISENQFYESNDIYGRKANNAVNFPNRIAFDNKEIRAIDLNKLFALETEYKSDNFLLNRTLLAIIIANKQVHSTPLTNKEGKYLENIILENGVDIQTHNDSLPFNYNASVLDNVIRKRKPKSEAIFEMLLMTIKPSPIFEANQKALIYNQFILGIQRQIDILSITETEIKIIEIKKRSNRTNPYSQVKEYLDYVNSDYRLLTDNGLTRQLRAIVLLEEGNIFLDKNQVPIEGNISVYSFNCDSKYKITFKNFA